MAPTTSELADEMISAARPRHAAVHLVAQPASRHVFLSDRSRLYDVDGETYEQFDRILADGDDDAVADLLRRLGVDLAPAIDPREPLAPPPVKSLSLNVAQRCNLACGYCYASGGDFGLAPTQMSVDVATTAVRTLIDGADPGERVNVAFLGGEPLISRSLIRHVVDDAVRRAGARGVRISFSITTNGTLVDEDDARFLAAHRFAVTVSIDGVGAVHDQLRPTRRGGGTYETILRRLGPLVARLDEISLSARVTVTPENLNLIETLDGLAAVGFPSIGFSPMLASPNGTHGLGSRDVGVLLAQMIECGHAYESALLAGRSHPFANLQTALTEIHRGVHRPYPCGAGAGYLSVSATGQLSACHRFVGDERGAMGDVVSGPDNATRAVWLRERHVDRQSPCTECWARYLCGGGCHHEVINRGRPMCDYIRGWLHYCLGAYVRLAHVLPFP